LLSSVIYYAVDVEESLWVRLTPFSSNEEHFIKSVNSWGRDPCEVRNEDVRNVVSAYKGETERKVLVV
jgi:hypothetical protein